MTYESPHAEAVKLENLAKDDLKSHTKESAQALLSEAFSIPPDEIHKVQAELKSMGSTSTPDCPEVFIDTSETQRMELVNGRQKTTIGEAAKGVVVSGSVYNGWFWSKDPETRTLYPNREPQTRAESPELFPSWMQFPKW